METDNQTSSDLFSQRKKDHIEISLRDESQAFSDQFTKLNFQHNAIPEIDFDEINLATEVFGKAIASPMFVSSMTLGHEGAAGLNHTILKACHRKGWMMGVGSQRRQLFDPQANKECEVLRDRFPEVVKFGNLGLSQLVETPVEKVSALVESLGARFMVVHCNPLQEAIQPEGTPQFKGGLKALETLCGQLSVPVVLKETGCGFSESNFQSLKNVGLAAIDVSGKGGTHWGRVEGHRMSSDQMGYQVAETFSQWGLTTVESLNNGVQSGITTELWASGGVRNGLQAAMLMALGAKKVGFAKPILESALKGEDNLVQLMERFDYELKVTLFCLGLKNVESLVGKRNLLK